MILLSDVLQNGLFGAQAPHSVEIGFRPFNCRAEYTYEEEVIGKIFFCTDQITVIEGTCQTADQAYIEFFRCHSYPP